MAGQIRASRAPDKNLVGYHSPYDAHVRAVAETLLGQYAAQVNSCRCIAELGSGAGLNLRYLSRSSPERLLAFDCSAQLLELARANLADLANVTYIHTQADNLPVPPHTSIDLLFTVTVLQHITDPGLFQSVTRAMCHSGSRYILLIEDTHEVPRQPTPDYLLRSPQHYAGLFGGSYVPVATGFASLSWARRVFGVINRAFSLYRRQEGAQLPRVLFAVSRLLSPLVRLLDRRLPGPFGMTAVLFEKAP